MNLGKRIELRLAELGWQQRDLCERIPELSPQTLSILIKRDSIRTQYDVQIADALGVTLQWLNEGIEPKHPRTSPGSPLADAAVGHSPLTSTERELIDGYRVADRDIQAIMLDIARKALARTQAAKRQRRG